MLYTKLFKHTSACMQTFNIHTYKELFFYVLCYIHDMATTTLQQVAAVADWGNKRPDTHTH